jgi:hypothetical protein
MIYVAGSIGPSAGWQEPTVLFSNLPYPELVPTLAAQVAAVMGFWNEYLPKASLVFMLAPAALWLFSFARRSLGFLMLLLLLPFALSSLMPEGLFTWMWNGYMDGYLALYFAIAMLLLGRYASGSGSIDVISAVCILLTIPNIKTEGSVAAAAGLPAVVWVLLANHDRGSSIRVWGARWKYIIAILGGLLPVVLWSAYLRQWGLVSDPQRYGAQLIPRLSQRIFDGSLRLILVHMWTAAQGALLLLGILLCAYLAWNRRLPKESLPGLLGGGLHGLGVIGIYLLTPFSVQWLVDTSLHRVMLSVIACLYVASYFLLDHLETEPG